ncbi:MAG: septum formation protein Maf [Bacteroidales bacterium]|jgi:septum formation protein|nr:septum formation protein Maf [Bacteroidales bacterium]MBR4512564.1 septum formation protein Maf [Bacteroidales bacterium]MBR6919992.1 septum formation protein Maf [Bacteroidales bacterium]
MLLDKLKEYSVVLASKSPRRQELLRGMGVEFVVCPSDAREMILPQWNPDEVVRQLASQKADEVYDRLVPESEKQLLVIGGDTIVVADGRVLGKPHDTEEAARMLRLLSGRIHRVYSGICIRTASEKLVDHDVAEVTFAPLSDDDISYYVERYHPLDKAGSYGVQEWIGYRGISRLEGSFYNVMGLPTHLLWNMLERLCGHSATHA